jgi:hypothetical protein
MKQCIGAVYCCGSGDRNCLGPAGCLVNDSEQVCEPLGGWQGPHEVHVDVARGYWNVLRRYLYVAVNFGPLAAEAGFCPGCDVCGETFPYIPGGDEATGRPPARVGGSVEVFEYLSPKVSGYQRVKSSRGRVADEVKVADLLGDDARPRAGTENLYLLAEDLAESHVLELKGRFVSDGCADPFDPGGSSRRAGQRIRHHIRCTWQIFLLVGVFGDEG